MTTEVPPELSTTIPGRPAVPDVLLEHLEELAHLTIQWRALLFSPEVPLRRLNVHARRIEAHVDGLRIGVPASLGIARSLLENGDPWLVFAAARAWLELAPRAPAEVLEVLSELAPEKRGAWRQAFRVLPPRISQAVFPNIGELSGPALEIATDALAWHGLLGPAALARLGARAEVELRIAVARHCADVPLQQRLAEDGNAAVRVAALWSEALLHPRDALARAVAGFESSKLEPVQVRIIGLFGQRSHASLLVRLFSTPALLVPALLALRDLAAAEAAESLLPMVGGNHPQAELAGEVFNSLTGWEPQGKTLTGPEASLARAQHFRNCDRGSARLYGKAFPWNEDPADEPMQWLWRRSLASPDPALSWLRKEVPAGLLEGLDTTEMLPGI